jgi:RHS repeat-associated protein
VSAAQSLGHPPENCIISTAGYVYGYDGDGERVEKCVPNPSTATTCSGSTSGTLYWRGIGTDTLDESDIAGNAQEEYVYFNGQRVARRDVSTNAVHYYFGDHLNSTSVVTDAFGSLSICGTYTVPTGEDESDYYPYGGEMVICNRVPQNYKFTGKERDSESGLDYFGARHYSSALGRFMVPDWAGKPTNVPYANFGNPQSLNLYSYVQNNPSTIGDPDGHCPLQGSSTCDGPKEEGNAASQAQNNSATFSSTKTTESFNDKTLVDTVSTVTTNVTLSMAKGHEGELLGASADTTTRTKDLTAGTTTTQTSTTKLDYAQAVKAAGGCAGMARLVDAVTPGVLTHFGSITAQDAREHPFKYAGAAGVR